MSFEVCGQKSSEACPLPVGGISGGTCIPWRKDLNNPRTAVRGIRSRLAVVAVERLQYSHLKIFTTDAPSPADRDGLVPGVSLVPAEIEPIAQGSALFAAVRPLCGESRQTQALIVFVVHVSQCEHH